MKSLSRGNDFGISKAGDGISSTYIYQGHISAGGGNSIRVVDIFC